MPEGSGLHERLPASKGMGTAFTRLLTGPMPEIVMSQDFFPQGRHLNTKSKQTINYPDTWGKFYKDYLLLSI